MITKQDLESVGFTPWFDKTERIWSWDSDRVMYDITQQTLYDADEVRGKHIKLGRIVDIEVLKDTVWNYFKIEIE